MYGCDTFYGLDVRYNGESIDFDEECELKAEGKEPEIEYVDGGTIYSFYHSNKEDEDYGGYSRPTLSVAQKWLRDIKNIDIDVNAEVGALHRKVYVPYISFYRPYVLTDIDIQCGMTEKDVKEKNLVVQKQVPLYFKDDNKNVMKANQYFETYEEALEAAIVKAMKIYPTSLNVSEE